MDNGRMRTDGWTWRAHGVTDGAAPSKRKIACLMILLAIMAISLGFLGAGCCTRKASFKVPGNAKTSPSETNFRVSGINASGSVPPRAWKADTNLLAKTPIDQESIRGTLDKLEARQNASLVPVTYDIRVETKEEVSSPDNLCLGCLSLVTLLTVPYTETTRTICNANISLPGEKYDISGQVDDKFWMSWLLLPVAMFDNPTDNSPSVESYVTDAIFSSLTKQRYDAAIAEMTKQARNRLLAGAHLSDVDRRLLDGMSDLPSLIAIAKRPDSVAKSREALWDISDNENLADIALHAEIPQIRADAAARIDGLPEARFASLARHAGDPHVGRIFLQNVAAEDLLSGIVTDASAHLDVRASALGKIGNETMLASIAKSPDMPMLLVQSAIDRIQTDSLVVDVAGKAKMPEARAAATRRISKQGILLAVVLKDSSPTNRLAALARISHPDALAMAVRKSGDPEVRLAATKRITDKSVLEEIEKGDKDGFVRLEAAQKLNDAEIFGTAARNDANADVRKAALSSITDENVLVEAATQDDSAEVRRAAVERISDQSVLVDIAAKDSDAGVRKAASARLTPESKAILDMVQTREIFEHANETRKAGGINFCGFYNGMPKKEFELLKTHYGLSESEAKHKGASMAFSLSAVRKITKGGNTFDELLEAVISRVGYLTPQSEYVQGFSGRGYLVEWFEYKTIDGVRLTMSDDADGLQIFFGP